MTLSIPSVPIQHENKKCGNYYRHKILSKTVTLFYIIIKTARLITIAVLAGKYHEISQLNFRDPQESKGCLKFRLKDFPR